MRLRGLAAAIDPIDVTTVLSILSKGPPTGLVSLSRDAVNNYTRSEGGQLILDVRHLAGFSEGELPASGLGRSLPTTFRKPHDIRDGE